MVNGASRRDARYITPCKPKAQPGVGGCACGHIPLLEGVAEGRGRIIHPPAGGGQR